MKSFQNAKSVLITGCSSGFGRQIVNRFLEGGGWQVFATTRHPERLNEITNNNLHILPFNVASKSERETIIQYVTKNCASGLDCLINNAGYGLAGPLETLTEEQIRQQFEVNFFAPLLLTQDLLSGLREAKGKVINISSLLGFVGMPMQSLYAASKFALEGLTESLYYELSSHGIQMTLVEPGGFRTHFADNIEWSSKSTPNPSVYEQQLQGYQNFLSRVSKKQPGKDPGQVADVVFLLANKRSMPLRIRVGKDSHAVYYLRRLLPEQIADRVLRKISKNILETM